MFGELRARLRALGEVIDQHMKGEGFPFEKGVKASLDAMHGTVQQLDNRVHVLEVGAGIKKRGDKPENMQAELDEAAQGTEKDEAQPAGRAEGKPAGEAGSQGEDPSA
jgi:hypothetical protein